MLKFEDFITIPSKYCFSEKDEVYSLLDKPFKEKLVPFLDAFLSIQKKENYPFLPKEKILEFPYTEYQPFCNEIFTRKQDIKILEERIDKHLSNKTIALEVGGWNGWLSNRLANYNVKLLSVDIFTDESNGLGSRKFYKNNNWLSLQADLSDTKFYSTKFDLIIFNHCLNFLPQPIDLLKKYINLLNEQGTLIILGTEIKKNVDKHKKLVLDFRNYYILKYGFKINFYDCDGFLNMRFYDDLIEQGFQFHHYELSFIGRLKKKISSEKSGVFIYQK